MKKCTVVVRSTDEWSDKPTEPTTRVIEGKKLAATIEGNWLIVREYDKDEAFTVAIKSTAFPANRVLEYSLE